ncbi:hypothetical protein [Actinomadura sp. HBU206391]|uniref:hypothetical protein n=1 Tax=Actinomadura sp. HBU206391 TaxID=2731692 RepID=UPI00164F1E2F|nr:hypothetical protein [Actinomadura sp. HBU206391]MBC6458089.1 hypothetical protein [Actinomadura sp. HBU206391]
MNDEREPASPKGVEPDGTWEQNPWIVIDDTQGAGWASFEPSETWNGMTVTPPGAAAARTTTGGTSNAVSDALYETASGGWSGGGGAPRAGASAGWAAPADDAVQNRSTDVAPTARYPDDGIDDGNAPLAAGGDDATGRWVRRALADRLPRSGAVSLWPVFVTFVITCLGVLLVVSSIIWRPHAP